MNKELLKYRIKLGGPGWLAKVAINCVLNAAKGNSKKEFKTVRMGSASPSIPKILYIHNGWAIENVGRSWFANQKDVSVESISDKDPALQSKDPDSYDYIWYGYSSLYHSFPCDKEKAIFSVHDPVELFPERPDWKSTSISPHTVEFLKKAGILVVTTHELLHALIDAGFHPQLIPTSSCIPLRTKEIGKDRPRVLSVGRIYARKNFELFHAIKRNGGEAGILRNDFYLKCDHFPLSEDRYIRLLYEYPIYLCTSFQEGGPLPAMDAMNCGAVVLSTPVGQMVDIIQDGVTGMICQTRADFSNALKSLVESPEKLQRMRIASLERIRGIRSEAHISAHVRDMLRNTAILNG